MGKWTLRRATAADADRLAACIDAAYAEYAGRIDDLPPMTEDMAGEIARNAAWVATIGEAVAGVLILTPGDGFMMLSNVAVHPDQRGIGLGKALLERADAEAVSRGFDEMRLNTHAGMSGTLGLYRRLGWQQTGRAGNKVSMRKSLAGRED